MKKITLLALGLASVMSGCSGDEESRDASLAYVYNTQMVVSCGYEGNLTLKESTTNLVALGLDVVSSSCARLTNISLTESCGDLTGEFYIHGVRPENLVDIENSSYREIETLKEHDFPDRYEIEEKGVGYIATSCTQ